LRENFLQRKLKELCDEHQILKAMNGPSQAQEKHMSSGFLKEESPPAATEINNALVPHQPRATAKASYMAYDEDSCDAD